MYIPKDTSSQLDFYMIPQAHQPGSVPVFEYTSTSSVSGAAGLWGGGGNAATPHSLLRPIQINVSVVELVETHA